jgi:hypothetical protein
MREFLGEVGACEIIVFATEMHVGDAHVSEFGSAAIALLAKENISNSYRLAQIGACNCMAQIGNFGFNVRHERCATVASNVCLAFAALCEASNAARLMESGASALTIQLMRIHRASDLVVAAAMRALCGLASLNDGHREALGQDDACGLIVSVVDTTESIAIIREGCEALMHLSISLNNASRLGESGACQVIVDALRDKLLEVDFGAEVCCGAMLNMALHGSSCQDNRRQLKKAGAIEVLRRAQMSTKASYRARENILQLLEILGADLASLAIKASAGGDGVSPSKQRGRGEVLGRFHANAAIAKPLEADVREYAAFSRTSSMFSTDDDDAGHVVGGTNGHQPVGSTGILEI